MFRRSVKDISHSCVYNTCVKHVSDATTDEELVHLSLRDSQYFGILIDRYEGKLMHYIRRRSAATPEDIQDILQEVFLKAYVNLNGFDPSLSFSSWMYRITHNTVVSWYRKYYVRARNRVGGETGEELIHLAADILDIEQVQWTQDMQTVIREHIEKLKPEYYDVLTLRFFEEKDYDEISDILKIPSGTVATRINRAKKKLRATLKPYL